jgi:hypothetical protein
VSRSTGGDKLHGKEQPEMSEITAAPAPELAAALTEASRKPILITVAEVLYSSAAALASRRNSPQPRRNYPARYAYLERALMQREMDRL